MRPVIAAILGCAVVAGAARAVCGQSGRVREPRPVPAQPAAPPPTGPSRAEPGPVTPPVPIPKGGTVAAQAADGASVRTVLENGTTLLVRENPATSVASIVTLVRIPDGGDARALRAAAAVAARSGYAPPAARLAALGSSLEIQADDSALTLQSTVLPRDVDAALAAHAAIVTSAEPPEASPVWTPSRTTVVVTGRVNAFVTLTTVQRVFGETAPPLVAPPAPPAGGRASGRAAAAVPAPEPPAPGPVAAEPALRYFATPGDPGPAIVSIVFDGDSASPESVADVESLAAVLGAGRSSRLALALSNSGLAVEVSARAVWTPGGRSLQVSLAAEAARLDECEAVVWREIDRLRRERLSDAELQRARNQAELDAYIRRSRTDDEAADLARLEAAIGDVRAEARRLARLRGASADDVQRQAAAMLVPARARIAEWVPPGTAGRPDSPAAYAARVDGWAPGLGKAVGSGEVRPAPQAPAVAEGADRGRTGERGSSVLLPVPLPVRDFSTLNGPKAIVREDASQPVVSIGLFFPGGRAAEPPATRGVTELLLRTIVCGSKAYPGDALGFAIERLGGRVRLVNEPDFFGIVVDVLSRNAELVMPIVMSAIEDPQIETARVLRERERLLADQRPSRTPPAEAARELWWQGRYPMHAYGVPATGLPETVSKLTDESVRSWYALSIRATYPLVAIVGDTDGSSLVSRFVVEGFERPQGDRVPSPALPAPSPVSEVAANRSGPQTVATIGVVTPGGSWSSFEAVDVAVAAVAVRLGSDGALSPGAWIQSGVERRRQAGGAGVVAGSVSADEAAVRNAVLAEFARIRSTAWTDDEIEAGRRGAVVRWTLDTSRSSDLAVAYVGASAFGRPLESVETYAERIQALPADEVRKVAAAVFAADRFGRGVVRGSGR